MSDVRISVALATYNGERHLPDQIRSVLDQTRPPDELVIADDGSTDATLDLVYDLTSGLTGTRLVVLESQGRLGVTANFDRAVRATTGDLVFLCDQDDVWSPRKVEVTASRFAGRTGELLGVFSDGTLIDDDGRPRPGRLWDRAGFHPPSPLASVPLPEVLRWNPVTGAALAFTGAVRDLALPFATTAIHDRWIALLLAAAGRIEPVADPLLRYRIHDANTVGFESRNPVTSIRAKRAADPHLGRDIETVDSATRRLDEAGLGSHEARAAFAEARAYLVYRQRLGPHAASRAVPVARAVLDGRYRRLGRGWRSALYDLMFAPSPT